MCNSSTTTQLSDDKQRSSDILLIRLLAFSMVHTTTPVLASRTRALPLPP